MTKRVTQYGPHGNHVRSEAAWPAHKVETLRFLVEAGMHSFAQVGEIMGITKNTVIGKAHRMGIEGPRTTGPRDDAEPSTLTLRLDALHAELDAILMRPRPQSAAGKPRPHMDSPEFVARRRA